MISANEARKNVEAFKKREEELFKEIIKERCEGISADIEKLSNEGETEVSYCVPHHAAKECQGIYEMLLEHGYKVEKTSATSLKIIWRQDAAGGNSSATLPTK